jgi:hypothetical protein
MLRRLRGKIYLSTAMRRPMGGKFGGRTLTGWLGCRQPCGWMAGATVRQSASSAMAVPAGDFNHFNPETRQPRGFSAIAVEVLGARKILFHRADVSPAMQVSRLEPHAYSVPADAS